MGTTLGTTVPAIAAELHGKVTKIITANSIVVSNAKGSYAVKLDSIQLPEGKVALLTAKTELSALALNRDVTIRHESRKSAGSDLTGTVQLDGPEVACMALGCPKPGLPDVSLELLQRGLVIVAPTAPAQYIEAQLSARNSNLGVWTKVRPQDRNPEM